MPDRTLVLGGARSGKSLVAERLFADLPDVVYVATGGQDAGSREWAARIAQHRARRPASWGLIETTDLIPLLESSGPPLLIDCLTLWLSQTMDALQIWTNPGRADVVSRQIAALTAAWAGTSRRVVAVSNEIGGGIVPAEHGTRVFRDLMGHLNTSISLASDEVFYSIAGRTLRLT
ncbi:bifunctional adenosylcobinamide kinase/adenosylcobinamide-phosphate guanylyltransferase [Kribbella sp. NBC_01505]|uniref:bifunctional adenosylcobinamide kinase/adenosylcobinamide-phosphate guanylyltransferase n=1 Tax=Kribbella sp. NBC_01505 TaxID=2903580 RepID=UPI0038682D9B